MKGLHGCLRLRPLPTVSCVGMSAYPHPPCPVWECLRDLRDCSWLRDWVVGAVSPGVQAVRVAAVTALAGLALTRYPLAARVRTDSRFSSEAPWSNMSHALLHRQRLSCCCLRSPSSNRLLLLLLRLLDQTQPHQRLARVFLGYCRRGTRLESRQARLLLQHPLPRRRVPSGSNLLVVH